ncbi:MAG: hypothetical protein AAF430_07425 [Myxococcota bacterium]
MRAVGRALLPTLLVLLGAVSLAAGDARVDIAAVETAHRQNDLPALETQYKALDREGTLGLRRRYLRAFIAWRANHVLRAKPDSASARNAWLETARVDLDAVLATDPHHVEALVLQAAVLGELSERSVWERLTLGRTAYELLERAIARGPGNPRAALQRGVFRLYAPGFAGGGTDAALAELERAELLFKTEPPDAWPGWGRVDVAAWLGQALVAAGRPEEARAHYLEGLAYAPPSPWIREVLLPELGPSPKP